MSCSQTARPGTFVRERIQPITKPKTIAMTVATTATRTVFQKMWAYRPRSMKLSRPYASGGRAWGSPTLSEAWKRKKIGYRTRMAAAPPTRRLTSRGPGSPIEPVRRRRTAMRSEAHDPVPLLHEQGMARLIVGPVRREEKLPVRELLALPHRRRVGAERAVQQERLRLVHVLSAVRQRPVQEELRGLRMRRLVHDADEDRGRGQPVGGGDEVDLGALLLEQGVARVLRERTDAIVPLREPVVELGARVEALGPLLGELLPEVVAVELPERVPLRVLHAGGGELRADTVLVRRAQNVLPRLRRLGGLHLALVVGDAREGDTRPAVVVAGIALILRLVPRVRRRVVLLPSALLLE